MFQVDANYTYMVRMHFCEPWYDKVNQRVFFIYINNQSVLGDSVGADVVAWTGGKGIPSYKDYAIYVSRNGNTNSDGDSILSLGLHPYDKGSSLPQYFDAILNGLEIFKINDNDNNLAAPNPTLSQAKAKAEEKRHEFEDSSDFMGTNAKVIGAATGAAMFGVAAVVGLAVCQKKRR